MKKFLLLLLFLLFPWMVRAEPPSTWQVVVFADGANALQVLSADGVDLSIPAGTLPLHAGKFPSAPLVALSSDRHTVVKLGFVPGQRLNVTIATGGACCKTLTISEHGAAEASIGPFNPDGTFFAVSYLAPIDEATQHYEAGIVIINVIQGVVDSRLDGARFGGDYAVLHDWTDDGISFQPICYQCDQPPSGTLTRWNPGKNTVTPNDGSSYAAQDTLGETGETILPVRRSDFPLPIQSDVAPQPNVVTYGSDARVIYYNPNDLLVNAAHWVADGWDVLVEHPDGDVLMDRSSVKRSITVDDQFLVGTPDGWLGTREINGAVEVIHHTLGDTSGTKIARFYHPLTVVQAPVLGASASQGGFSVVNSPVHQITCPNTLPPRLVAGGKGRAIISVNIRSAPSLVSNTVSQLTTQIFDVVSGPTCDPTGIAWWQVQVGGLRGWVAEGKDGSYLLEPVLN